MRSVLRILVVFVLAVTAGAVLADAIPNWSAPPTWTPAGGNRLAGVKSAAAVTYNAVPFIPITPCRLADTRTGSGFTGQWGPPSIVAYGQRSFTIAGQCGIPSGATAVSFNFAVWAPTSRGNLRVWPAGAALPTVSTLNWESGILALANAAVVPLGTGGAVTVRNDSPTSIDIFVDVNGYYSTDMQSANGADLYISSSVTAIYAMSSASSGTTIWGYASGSGNSWGVLGSSAETGGAGIGVYGAAYSGQAGVYGGSNTGVGVEGGSTSNTGVYGHSTSGVGVMGLSSTHNGVWAETTGAWDGLFAKGGRHGAFAISTATSGLTWGVFGASASNSNGAAGVHGEDYTGAPTGFNQFGPAGVTGASASGYAGVLGIGKVGGASGGRFARLNSSSPYASGADAYLAPFWGDAAYFYGNTYVYANSTGGSSGSLYVQGSLTKGSGTFMIDHPLDPENKYLYHSFVESPDMMNVYNGVVELGPDGSATVTLPSYFEALNKDFRYQLTAIGMAQPNLHVALEVDNNTFVIGGGRSNQRVSWQVTGVRKDPFANAHRVVPEVEKEAATKGLYLHPAEYGKKPDQGVAAHIEKIQTAKEALRAQQQPQQ